jgi:hypothetical protein
MINIYTRFFKIKLNLSLKIVLSITLLKINRPFYFTLIINFKKKNIFVFYFIYNKVK